MEQGAAPAGGDERTPKLPGGAGAPPGDTTVSCQELADGGAVRLARGARPAASARGPRSRGRRRGETARQKARPGAVTTPRWSAERRPHPSKEDAAR